MRTLSRETEPVLFVFLRPGRGRVLTALSAHLGRGAGRGGGGGRRERRERREGEHSQEADRTVDT